MKQHYQVTLTNSADIKITMTLYLEASSPEHAKAQTINLLTNKYNFSHVNIKLIQKKKTL